MPREMRYVRHATTKSHISHLSLGSPQVPRDTTVDTLPMTLWMDATTSRPPERPRLSALLLLRRVRARCEAVAFARFRHRAPVPRRERRIERRRGPERPRGRVAVRGILGSDAAGAVVHTRDRRTVARHSTRARGSGEPAARRRSHSTHAAEGKWRRRPPTFGRCRGGITATGLPRVFPGRCVVPAGGDDQPR